MRQHRWHAVSGAALVLALMPAAGHAADLVQTLKDHGQFSELVRALDQAGLAGELESEGPYTVFAPTNEAFGKLPDRAIEQLSQGEGQLAQVLKHHVVEGKEVMAKDVLGQETKVGTLSGDEVTVDGTGAMVVLVPTGLTITRIGDEVFVERDVAAMATPAVTVSTTDQQQAGTSGSSGQQQAAASGSGSGEQQTTGTQNPEAAAGQELTQEERSAAAQQQSGGTGQGQPMAEQQGMLRAAMVVEPDIQADNGVIHAIDEVLVPQKIEQQLEQAKGQQGSSGGQPGSSN